MTDFKFFLLDPKQQCFYEIVREAIAKHEQWIPIKGLTVSEVNSVLKAVLTDTPDFFWFEGKWSMENLEGKGYLVPKYTFDTSASYEIRQQLDNICKDFCMTISSNKSTYEILRVAYDWLITNVQYGVSQSNGQTIYDALIARKAVCKGLSKGLQYLLKQINCFSTLKEGTLDGVTKHIWNIVEINNKYYNVDVSMGYEAFSYLFEGNERNNRYRCFAVSDTQLLKTHRINYAAGSSLRCNYDYIGGL